MSIDTTKAKEALAEAEHELRGFGHEPNRAFRACEQLVVAMRELISAINVASDYEDELRRGEDN